MPRYRLKTTCLASLILPPLAKFVLFKINIFLFNFLIFKRFEKVQQTVIYLGSWSSLSFGVDLNPNSLSPISLKLPQAIFFLSIPIEMTFESKLLDILSIVSKNIPGYIGSRLLNCCSRFAEMALQNLSTSLLGCTDLYICHLKQSVQELWDQT